jgi:hypothetical protein
MTKDEREKLLAAIRLRFKERKKTGLEPEYIMMHKGDMSGLIHPEHIELRLEDGWKFFNF